jgi:hypothetical protein
MRKLGMPYTLGPVGTMPVPGCFGFVMRFNREARKCVVFLGWPDHEAGPSAINCAGTGFLLLYQGGFYLVTARHVAEVLGDVGFCVRVNQKDGSSKLLHAERVPWAYHPDSSVDVAISGFGISAQQGFDFLYLDGEILLLKQEQENTDWVEVGDVCYTAGLWRLLEGKEKNLPIIHTGHIARLAGEERIPVKAPNRPDGREMVDGYLVEAQTLSGLSGSPVFIRPSLNLELDANDMTNPGKQERLKLVAYRENVKLLGLWQAAWDLPSGEVLSGERGKQVVVPVGMGIVVPASRIVEVLELPVLKEPRNAAKKQRELKNAAEPQATGVEPSGSTEENPNVREDFMRLQAAAAQKQKQDG